MATQQNTPAKQSQAPAVISKGVQAVQTAPLKTEAPAEVKAAPAAPAEVINRGAQPSPAVAAANIAKRQEAAKPEGVVAAVPGSKTAEMLKNLKKPGTTSIPTAAAIGDILKDVPAANQYPITRICEYITRMDPRKPEDVKSGAVEQAALYHGITNIINNQEKHFAPLFTALLRLFNTYNTKHDVFHDYNCSRFMEFVNLNSDERKAFNNLTCLLKAFANPDTRELAKRNVDHVRLLSMGLTEDGRQRVLSFLEL